MAHDVFISHSSKDKETATAVCEALEAEGIRCWIAPRDIVPGVEWSEAVVNGISGSRVVVLVLTSAANASGQVRREVQLAFEGGITVIPFRVEDVEPVNALRYYLTSVHYLNAVTCPLEQHLGPLTDGVRAQLARSDPRQEPDQDRANKTPPDPKDSNGPQQNPPDETGAEPAAGPHDAEPVSRYHQVWVLKYEGHEIRVVNDGDHVPETWGRLRLYIDSELAADKQEKGFWRNLAAWEVAGTLVKTDGGEVEVRARVSQGFLGLSVKCQIWTDGIPRTPRDLGKG